MHAWQGGGPCLVQAEAVGGVGGQLLELCSGDEPASACCQQLTRAQTRGIGLKCWEVTKHLARACMAEMRFRLSPEGLLGGIRGRRSWLQLDGWLCWSSAGVCWCCKLLGLLRLRPVCWCWQVLRQAGVYEVSMGNLLLCCLQHRPDLCPSLSVQLDLLQHLSSLHDCTSGTTPWGLLLARQ